jgi:hypothetical protein
MGRSWHFGLARQSALILALMVAMLAIGRPWLAALTLPTWFLARAVKVSWQKRQSFAFDTLHPARVLGTALMLVLLDVATWTGAVRWLASRFAPERETQRAET